MRFPTTMGTHACAALVAFSTSLLFLPQTPAPPVDGGQVVAHWRFQYGAPGLAAHPLLLLEDSSGNDRHAQAIGGPVYRSVCLPSSNLALSFDGGDDRLFVADDPLFHLIRSLTLEAYIQVDRYPTANRLSQILFRGDARLGFDPWFLAVNRSGQLVFGVSDARNAMSAVVSHEPLPVGRFVHVAGTLDDATGVQSLYVDGRRVASTDTDVRACGPLGGGRPGIGIGNRQEPSDHAFKGTIDEVRISAAALTPSQFLRPPRSDL